MRVLGIDCGGQYTGYGIVEETAQGKLRAVCFGAVRLKTRETLEARLLSIFRELQAKIDEHTPDIVAIEDVFYGPNPKSMLKLGEVRGVAMLAASSCGLKVAEYAPRAIKSAVVGYGAAEKSQVQHMVKLLLGLPDPPEPVDAADALAIAICHIHTSATLRRQATAQS